MSQLNPEVPTMSVDMDGVLADFDKEIIDRLAARHPDIPITRSGPHFYVSQDYPQHAQLQYGGQGA
jgi:hypothetical protein